MNRNEILNKVKEQNKYDAIIIGGGATGLGVGVELITKGLKVLLLEQSDFAKATSSRSTKLLHGGVRYLAQMNFKLIREALKERDRLYKNIPNLTDYKEFIVPCYSYFQLAYYGAGLKLYDALAGFPKGKTSKAIGKKKLLSKFAGIKEKGLVGGILYYDGVFDDARMALALAQTINNQNSEAVNYVKVSKLLKQGNVVSGVEFIDELSKEVIKAQSSCVINATGIFADNIRRLDEENVKPIVSRSKGVHIVIEKDVFTDDTTNSAILIPKTSDGRVLFAVPWHNKMIVGTTDEEVKDAPLDPKATDKDIDFILENLNQYTEIKVKKEDVNNSYAGIRPLILAEEGDTSSVSREEKIIKSDSNLVTIIGGKWSSYRHMAEKMFDFLQKSNLLSEYKVTKDSTKNKQLYSYISREKVDSIAKEHLLQYGSNLSELEKIEGYDELLSDKFPFNKAQVIYAVRCEAATCLDDVLSRRMRATFLNAKEAANIAEKVANIMAEEMNKDSSWINIQLEQFNKIVKTYIIN